MNLSNPQQEVRAFSLEGDTARAMSRENVEALRRLYGEWAKGDMWALRDIADPNIEWEWSEGMASLFGGPRIYRGLEEIDTATREWLTAWDSYWMTAEDSIDGGEKIVVFMHLHGQTASTGNVVEQRCAAVWVLRDGKAARVRYYDADADALEAAGLSEQAMSQENVEVVRRIYASLTRADDEAVMGLFAPDAVVDFSRRLVEPFVVRLDRKVLASLRHEYLENWSEPPTWEPEELFDTGDKVLAFVRFSARGKASGVEVETHVAHVWKFRDGKPVELKYFGEDRAAALQAAGLTE